MEQNSLQPELSPVRHLLRNFRPAASPNLEPRLGRAFVAGAGMFTIGAGACEPRSYLAASSGVRRFGNRVRMYCRIQLVVVRSHHLGEWLIPSHHDAAPRPSLTLEARTLQRPDTVPAGDARQLRHTATTIVSNRSGGTGR
jgi:hypothetical protein